MTARDGGRAKRRGTPYLDPTTDPFSANGPARMIYVLAFLLPPLALLIEGHVFNAILNAVLYVVLLVVAILATVLLPGASFGLLLICSAHAIIVIMQSRRKREHAELVAAAREGRIGR